MNGIISANLGGKIRPLRFGMLAFETLLEISAENDSNIKSNAKVIYAGLLNAAEVNNSVVDFTFADVYGWIDDMFCTTDGNETILEIERCFEKSNMYQNILKPQIDKKKDQNQDQTK
jgi:hypothetical protein